MQGKNFYTKEDYQKAKNISLLDYLESKGYQLKKAGNQYVLSPHDSLFINPDKNVWKWFSKDIGGNVIDFLVKYESKTIVEAINELAGNTYEMREFTRYEPIPEDIEKGEIILPTKNKENKRAWSYLTKTRGIDSEIVKKLIEQGYIYENDKGGVVFISKDKENNVKFACVRSTSHSSFKQDITNSNKEYGFKTVGKSNKLFVFEAPIDLLSHATISKMQGREWQEDNRISLGGVSDKALEQFLKDNQNITEIVLFLDNDETGLKNAQKIAQKYGNDYNIKIFTSTEKDLNETLITYQNEKKSNENLKINSFVKQLEKPFIPPKFKEEKTILNTFNDKIKDINLNHFLRNNLLEIGETIDNKMVVLFKENDKYKVIQGGLEVDINNLDFKPKFLNGSKENYMFLENVDENCKEKTLIFTDNLLFYMYHKEYIEDFHMVLIDNLTLENIIKIKEKLPNIYDKIGFMHSELDSLKYFQNIQNLEKMLGVSKCFNEDFVGMDSSFFKEAPKQSLKDKIKDKQAIINQTKQEKGAIYKQPEAITR